MTDLKVLVISDYILQSVYTTVMGIPGELAALVLSRFAYYTIISSKCIRVIAF